MYPYKSKESSWEKQNRLRKERIKELREKIENMSTAELREAVLDYLSEEYYEKAMAYAMYLEMREREEDLKNKTDWSKMGAYI